MLGRQRPGAVWAVQPGEGGELNGARCYARSMDTAAEDLMGRLKDVHDELESAQKLVADLAAERRVLVLELRDRHGWSDARIAGELGVSRAAVQALRNR